jgi:glutamate formiminotransferase
VLLYGLLAGGRTRAELRRGGIAGLVERGTRPDFGPREIDPRRGAVLIAARPPLVAFNFELAAPAALDDARAIAAEIRGEHVKALGLELPARAGVAQVSTNVEDHRAVPLAAVLGQIRRHAEVTEAELVGLAPEAAFDGWPDDVPIRNRRTVEDALAA